MLYYWCALTKVKFFTRRGSYIDELRAPGNVMYSGLHGGKQRPKWKEAPPQGLIREAVWYMGRHIKRWLAVECRYKGNYERGNKC